MKIYLKEECYKIMGACFEVHKHLGPGFLEAVYAEALEMEFNTMQIPYERKKALSALTPQHEAQVLNYLKATGLKIGLLVNFGETSLKSKRLVK